MPSFCDVLPPGASNIGDGNVVFLDFRKGRDTPHDTSFAGLVEGVERVQEDPLAQIIVTANDTKSLARLIMEDGSGSVRVEVGKGDGYSHAVLEGWMGAAVPKGSPHVNGEPGEEYGIKMSFIPRLCEKNKEEGEVEMPAGSKEVGAVLRQHSSYLYEVHRNDDKMYIHGMRRVTAQVCWWLCGNKLGSMPIGIATKGIPIVPPGITVDECIEVIKAMELESSPPTEVPEGSDGVCHPFNKSKKGTKRSLTHSVFLDAKETVDEVKRMGIKEVEPLPCISDPKANISIYPSSMLGYRQMQGTPGCVDAITFILRASKRGERGDLNYTKESAAKAVCGARCALERDSACDHSGVYRGGFSAGGRLSREPQRIHFLEDIECDEMHHYAKEVGSLIEKERSISMRPSMDWGNAGRVTLHCVYVGKDDKTPVFAFCKEGTIRPFAMTGMRHLLWDRVSIPSAVQRGGSIHQYKESKEAMVQELVRQVSPKTSTLNHRQRFALQQSFIMQVCTMHKGTPLWDMKKVLRGSILEWYRRRVSSTVRTCEALGHDIGIDPDSKLVQEPDMTFMLSMYSMLLADVNPHWWFASCVA